MNNESDIRFKLEEEIVCCWNITTDIELINEYGVDKGAMVRAIKAVYDAKFSKLFNTFEQLIKENKL